MNTMQDNLRVGLLGGTFDPPTFAHINIAKKAFEILELDELWFIPVWVNPHKYEKKTTSPEIRLELLKAAVSERLDKSFTIKTLEIDRKEKSYAIVTVEQLKKENPDTEFILIQGYDSLISFNKWYRYSDILDLVKTVFITRPDYDISQVPYDVRSRVSIVEIPPISISSTMVREKVANGESITSLVPQNVASLIRKHRLFTTS
jgi:nicotinate-nucleotide adenylyltransferase